MTIYLIALHLPLNIRALNPLLVYFSFNFKLSVLRGESRIAYYVILRKDVKMVYVTKIKDHIGIFPIVLGEMLKYNIYG